MGLSPRVRGNPRRQPPRRPHSGSIPARAGEPQASGLPSRRLAVYPRACGGTPPASGAGMRRPGLSPRVRGNRYIGHAGGLGEGSIPARAGEPQGQRANPAVAGVYPRACGGTCVFSGSVRAGIGLSPRVRGNRLKSGPPASEDGSIPARAGEPTPPRLQPDPQTVYPRACGGTSLLPLLLFGARGLSPRVRGNHCTARNLAGNPDSPQAVIFLASITDVMMGS